MIRLRPSNEAILAPDCGALRTGGEQIMAEAELFQPRRFRTAAPHYLTGRPAYAPRLIGHVARFTGLTRNHRVLDLGCGPGMLAGAFAPLAAEVVAIDPEPEMLRIAAAEFGAAGRIRFLRGSSYELSPALGRFRVVTMGRSFQWMDRAETLARLDEMVEPGGAVVLFNSEHRETPEAAWIEQYRAVVRQYAESDGTHVRRRSPGWVRHEVMLLDSAFSRLDEIAVIERRQVCVAQLVERTLSRSSTTVERLGAAADRLAEEIGALLTPLATDGWLTEVMATNALIAGRPGEEESRHE
jgi:2-polyprenyl-3-methyl-5-hydroxy-6-metoxy-1,4-benzoquinol methylase